VAVRQSIRRPLICHYAFAVRALLEGVNSERRDDEALANLFPIASEDNFNRDVEFSAK
jgi:hypothetical protein